MSRRPISDHNPDETLEIELGDEAAAWLDARRRDDETMGQCIVRLCGIDADQLKAKEE